MIRLFETVLVEQCAPTLAGIKPANLFRYQTEDRDAVYTAAERLNGTLRHYGIAVRILKECCKTHAFLVYVYREMWLGTILSDRHNLAFLRRSGYNSGGSDALLEQLSVRLCMEAEFPHEIGIFLGYPLEDVTGFIENHGENYTCSGYWKSYGDPVAARTLFDRYKHCTSVYRQRYRQGDSLLQLAASVC